MPYKGNKRSGDRIVAAIEITQFRLAILKDGLMLGESLEELEKLARDVAIAATSIETLVAMRHRQGRNKIV